MVSGVAADVDVPHPYLLRAFLDAGGAKRIASIVAVEVPDLIGEGFLWRSVWSSETPKYLHSSS